MTRAPITKHGRDHRPPGTNGPTDPGGHDPIPGLGALGGTIDAAILATFPGAYYKLNETASSNWADSSGANRTATYVSRTGEVRGVASTLDEGDGSLCVTVNGPSAGTGVATSHIGIANDNFFCFPATAEFTVTARIRLALLPGSYSFGICGNVSAGAPSDNQYGFGLFIAGTGSGGIGKPLIYRGISSGSNQMALGAAAVTVGQWIRLTGVFDGSTLTLYTDNTLVATTSTTPPTLPASGSQTSLFQLGCCGIPEGIGGTQAPWNGELDSVAVWDRALTPSEVGGIVDAGTAGAPTGAAGGALDGTYPNPGIAASVAGAGLAETTDVLSVNVDGSTIEINTDTLRVKADGITANEIAANAVGASELAATSVSAGNYGDSTHVATFTVDADGRLTAASNATVTASGGIGEILVTDTPSTPLVFADLIQTEAQDDLLYADP